MTSKGIRIYDLARRFAVPSRDILDMLRQKGLEVASHMSSIDAATADLLLEIFQTKRKTDPNHSNSKSIVNALFDSAQRDGHGERSRAMNDLGLLNTFTQMSISGYRRLLSVKNLEMRALTVMIGANGIGKTSFLEVFALLAASARGELQNALSKLGGASLIVTRNRSENVTFNVSMAVIDHKPLDYMLTLNLQGAAYEIGWETLTQEHPGHVQPFKYIESQGLNIKYWNIEGRKLVRPTWEHSPFETSLAQVPKMYRAPEIFRKHLGSCTYYSAHALNVGYNSPIRLPQAMQPVQHPGNNGENLAPYLYYLRETHPDRFELIEDTLAVAFRGFEQLNFPPVAAGTLTMTWKDANFSQPLYLNQLSEGILRFLWLIALLYSPHLTAVTLLDEPEVSLHPELLNVLGYALRDASKATQLIVATHSERLIGFLQPAEVLVLDSEDGFTTMTWADTPTFDLERWLQDYTLDELWRMGRIGGRS